MQRQIPVALWIAVIVLGLISVIQFIIAVTQGNLRLLIAVGANLILIAGLLAGHRWAYVLTLFFCITGGVVACIKNPNQGLLILIGNGLVAVPILFSTDYFWGRRKSSETVDPLRCPNCGYSLLGLTVPRCPECGQEFEMPV